MTATLVAVPERHGLTSVAEEVAQCREVVRQALSAVSTMSAEDVTRTREAHTLALELARIRKYAEHVQRDLLRLEVECFRRLAELDRLDMLPANHRKAAAGMAKMSPEEVDSFIREATLFRAASAWRGSAGRARWAAGRAVGESEDYAGETFVPIEGGGGAASTRAALAEVMARYVSTEEPFTVSDVVETMCADLGDYGDRFDEGMREGLGEVARRVIRSAPVLTHGNERVPRFVTFDTAHGQYMRVPTERATVDQLRAMVELRRQQLVADQRAFDRLSDFLRAAEMSGLSGTDTLAPLVQGVNQ